MLINLSNFALMGLLPLACSRFLPSKTTIGRVRAVAAPAIPTSTLVSDFKKNNVSAQWAEGHPKEWGSEEAKFEYPIPLSESVFSGTMSPDEKFIAMANMSSVKIVNLSTKALVATFKLNSVGQVNRIMMQAASGGGYELFVSTVDYETTRNDTTVRVQISEDGTPKGEQILYPGRVSSFDKTALSKDGRRLVTAAWPKIGVGFTLVYDLDKPGSNITLAGHTDWVMSSAFSHDNKYISTTAWDGYTKVWNTTNGELIHTFGPTGKQNWFNDFSPDGKYLVVTSGGFPSVVNIWSVANFSAEPIVFQPYINSVRTAAWSSDSELLAFGSTGIIHIYSMKEQKIVQKWEMEDQLSYEAWELAWIESESGKKLTYRTTGGLEMYDFETNLKYRWGPGDYDSFNRVSGDYTVVVKSKGWIGGVDADSTMRFYKFLA